MDLQVYIDETKVYLDGEACLLYGPILTEDSRLAIRRLNEIRTELAVPVDVEIKWNFSWGEPQKKKEIKEAVIMALQGFTFLVSISQTRDKNEAFRNMLKQVHSYCIHKCPNGVGPSQILAPVAEITKFPHS